MGKASLDATSEGSRGSVAEAVEASAWIGAVRQRGRKEKRGVSEALTNEKREKKKNMDLIESEILEKRRPGGMGMEDTQHLLAGVCHEFLGIA